MKTIVTLWRSVTLLISGGGLVAFGAVSAVANSEENIPSESEVPALKDVFKDHFLIGGAYNRNVVTGRDPRAAEIAIKHFNTATSENDMKWSSIHPQLGRYNWGPADSFMEFCEDHNMAPIGHTLVWHSQVPGWVFTDDAGSSLTREALLARMEEHITAVAGRYKGRMKGWDVVNEALNDNGTLRNSQWLRIIGEGNPDQQFDYLAKAFEFAHAADPDAELYYNDYNLSTSRAKADGAVAIVRHLQSKGIRIDGVGMQVHAGLEWPRVEDLEYAINALAETGVKVMVTELDIRTRTQGPRGAEITQINRGTTADPEAVSAAVQQRLADKYAEIFSVLVKHKEVIPRVTFWGVYDTTSWIGGSPLLFDGDYQPKQAFHAVVATASDQRGAMVPWEKGAWETGEYRNVFLEAGYRQEDINAKLNQAYHDLFEGPNRVYFEVGDDMAYVSDIKNKDARTEGLSYGLMVAVQLDKKEVFDKLWRWTARYMQHQEGPREGYFAWSVNPETGQHNSAGSASDGELFFVTALLFASNLWGNETGIDYYGEARRILDAMWSKDGTGGVMNIINVEHKMITFVPGGRGYNWTDPSYHVPAFFEIWAEYANDGREDFYRECADVARQFLHKACHPVSGLTPDYAEYDGSPLPGRMSEFGFDSWRVPMNIAMDYSWYAKDKEWQIDYGKRLHDFLYSQGVNSFVDQYSVDGSPRETIMTAPGYSSVRHSLGFVSTAATAAIMGTQAKSWEFVDGLWNAKLEPYEDGYFDPYYDGFLYLFSLMHLSGNYQIIKPATGG